MSARPTQNALNTYRGGPDERGHFGLYGGRFVAETLMPLILDLERAYSEAKADPSFKAEMDGHLATYVGRPSPLYFAERLTEHCGGAKIYFKREELNHTGAHKVNNVLGQIMLALRMGKTRIIAETGAGMHGVATATLCAKFGLPCIVYMGSVDVARQKPNVLRMKILGAEVRAVELGSKTLKDAMNEALRDWVWEGLLGAGMGFAVRLLFAVMEAALGWLGQVSGRNLYQPWLAENAPDDASLRQLGFWLAGLAFFSANGHLLLIQALQHSLAVLPAAALPDREGARALFEAGSMIFSTGLQLALPLLLLALLAQGVFAVVSRLMPGVDAWSVGLNLGALTLLGSLAVGVPILVSAVCPRIGPSTRPAFGIPRHQVKSALFRPLGP